MSVNEEMTALADAIRGKTGLTRLLSIAEMTQAVKAMQSVITDTVRGRIIGLTYSAETKLLGLRIFGETAQNGAPTPDAPVELVSAGVDGNILIQMQGKNMFYIPAGETNTQRGVTLTVLPDGRIQIHGTKTESAESGIYYDQILAAPYVGKTVTVRSEMANIRVQCNIKLKDGTKEYHAAKNNLHTFTIPENAEKIGWQVSVDGTGSYDNVIVHPYAVLGTQVGEWEPYIAPQTLTISTPNGLPGIPVASGGNYTDENGQQWICDEVDFGRGIHIQRIGKIDSYNGEPIGNTYLSSTGTLSSGAVVLYPLENEAETATTDDELAAYAALHTYYPNTTIYNDANAMMEASFVVDTKTYIDNQVAALSAAMIGI